MSFLEVYRKARASLMTEAIELGGALLVIAIIIGIIAIPIFMQTNTSGWSTTNVLIWGTVITITLAALVMLIINKFRRTGGE
jgi:hypothetical protein